LAECKNVTPSGVANLRQALPSCEVWVTNRLRGIEEVGHNDLKAIEKGLMHDKEYGEADLALQKFISNWKEKEDLPFSLIAEAYRLRGECQKALGNMAESQSLMVESARYGKQVKDLEVKHRE
jgi:hypothetical protein